MNVLCRLPWIRLKLKFKLTPISRNYNSFAQVRSNLFFHTYFSQNPTTHCRFPKHLPWKIKSVRYFRTTAPLYVPPVLIILLRPLSKIFAIVLGRQLRKWYYALPPEEKTKFWQNLESNRRQIMMGISAWLGFIFIYYGTHIEPTPVTSRRRFMLFSSEEFDAVSKKMYEMNRDFYRQYIVPTSHPLHKYVTSVTQRLISKNNDIPEIREKSWSVTIIDTQDHNAYVLPSGDIFVFGGMLEIANNEDQLGCILGHEMAHAILRHSAELLSYLHLVDLFMVFVITGVWAILPTDLYSIIGHIVASRLSALLVELPKNRKLETEADRVGLELAAKACFDIRQSSVFWTKMSRQAQRRELFEWFSTHPNHQKRAGKLDELVPKALKTREESNCPPLPATDPRGAQAAR